MDHAPSIMDQDIDLLDSFSEFFWNFIHFFLFSHFSQNQVNVLVSRVINNLLDGFFSSFLVSADKINDSIEFGDFFGSSKSNATVGPSDNESLSSHVGGDFGKGFFSFGEGLVTFVHELEFADEFHFDEKLDWFYYFLLIQK